MVSQLNTTKFTCSANSNHKYLAPQKLPIHYTVIKLMFTQCMKSCHTSQALINYARNSLAYSCLKNNWQCSFLSCARRHGKKMAEGENTIQVSKIILRIVITIYLIISWGKIFVVCMVEALITNIFPMNEATCLPFTCSNNENIIHEVTKYCSTTN